MKTKSKKIVSLLLVLIVAFTIIPSTTFSVHAGLSISQIQAKFPDGKYWNHVGGPNNPDGWTNTPCTHHDNCNFFGGCDCNSFSNAIQCMGYAFKVAYDYYGSSPRDWGKSYDVNTLKPGDYVRYWNDGHSIWITNVDGNNVTYTEANIGGTCIIKWGSTTTKQNIASTLTYIAVAPYAATWGTITGLDIGTNFYAKIVNTASELCLTNDLPNVSVRTSTGQANQIWYFERQSGNSYKITSVYDNKCLDVYNANPNITANVWTCADNGSNAQRWVITGSPNAYVFMAKCGNTVLDLQNGGTTSGTNVQMYTSNGSNAQLFSVVKVSPITFNINSTNKNTEHVIFSWNAVPNAVSYNLRVDSNGDGSAESDVSVSNIQSTSYSKLLPIGNYSVWLDAIDSQGKCFLTNRDYRPNFAVVQGDNLPQKTVTYNKHVYSIYNETLTWKEAKSVCETMGGHLATITSAGEQQAIENLVTGGTRSFYHIGGTDEVTEGSFKWITGESFLYTNWDTGQPSNSDGVQDYMMVYNMPSNFGKWNDIASRHNDSMAAFGFICEIEPVVTPVATTTYNGSKYMLFDNNMTWKDAKAMCETLGGHLVTITSPGEQTAINSLLASGKKSFYTIGASDDVTEGTFKWVTNETLSFTNWDAKQPDNWANVEDYLMLFNSGTVFGKWNDVQNNHSSSYGFICEVLTAPTFIPSLTAPTNGNVTVNINYPALATTKEYKIGAGSWTPYTVGITLTSNNTIYARCSDGPGYYSPTSSYVVKNIDKTPPATPTFTLNPSIPTIGGVLVTINFPADAAHKEYKIGLGEWGVYQGPFEMDVNNTVSARCNDAAGNISNIGSVNVNNIAAKPITPANVKAVSSSYNSVKISWDSVSGASGYLVYRYNASTKNYERIKTITAISFINTSLTTGKTYYYKVFAYKTVNGSNIYSAASAVVSAKPVPATPVNFKAVRYSATSIKLTWDPVTGASGYVLYKYNASTKSYERFKVLTSTSYINTGLTKGVTYYYKVRAYRTMNGSPIYGNPTAAVSAKTY